jgi:hypothetical protein
VLREALIVGVSLVCGLVAADPKPRAPVAALACETPNDCSIYPRNCCAGCTAATEEERTAAFTRDAVAYNGDWVEQHGQPGCADKTCGSCPEPLASRVFPSCERARCVVKDVDRLGVTACKADGDCAAWVPGCCACGWNAALAVRKDAVERLRQLACAPGTGCGRCAATGPEPATVCRKKRCELVEPPAPRARGPRNAH